MGVSSAALVGTLDDVAVPALAQYYLDDYSESPSLAGVQEHVDQPGNLAWEMTKGLGEFVVGAKLINMGLDPMGLTTTATGWFTENLRNPGRRILGATPSVPSLPMSRSAEHLLQTPYHPIQTVGLADLPANATALQRRKYARLERAIESGGKDPRAIRGLAERYGLETERIPFYQYHVPSRGILYSLRMGRAAETLGGKLAHFGWAAARLPLAPLRLMFGVTPGEVLMSAALWAPAVIQGVGHLSSVAQRAALGRGGSNTAALAAMDTFSSGLARRSSLMEVSGALRSSRMGREAYDSHYYMGGRMR